ncbi:hypothetical protein LTR37_019763 [Vermiconidia calcicola]|uniref:Uncharacterized protein n=1 Tax=Vermiconidia calcicola TaxID=1690605 RepID=A0ACC3MEP0_9PEZI|nr:hypothetical protein LTR37_019763 [Vermiconidia calcicola]
MAKRKRDDDASEDEAEVSAKQRRVQYKLDKGTAKLRHAFKVAKGFERQKLGRRRKKPVDMKKEIDIDRIDAEIAALKTLDTSASAQHHLYKTLSKIKAVSKHSDLPPEVKNPLKLPTDAAILNLNSRLCQSSPVKEALDIVVAEVRDTLGIPPNNSKGSKKKQASADLAAFSSSSAKRPRIDGPGVDSDAHQPSKGGAVRKRNEATDDSADESGALDGRVAMTSDEDDVDEDIEGLEERLAMEGIRNKSARSKSKDYDIEADSSMSRSDLEPPSASPEPQKAPAPEKSAFIPSLTMGGYISGSGSDIEDIDMAPKKNRRGQRARQQIWEQKFGTKAKHLQKEERNTGWDPKRGATDNSQRRGKAPGRRERRASPNSGLTGGSEQHRSKPGSDAKNKHKDDSGPLHPSWEAAKKAKSKKEAPIAFQGKKITFD